MSRKGFLNHHYLIVKYPYCQSAFKLSFLQRGDNDNDSMMIVRQSIAEVTRVGVSCVGKWGDLNLLTTSWSSSSSWTLIKTLPKHWKHWKHWKRQQNLAASASDLNLLTTSWFVFNTWRKMMKRQKKSCSKWPLSRNNSYSSILSTLLRILIFLFKKNDID